mmetsp:Transcript_255/g.615  ORF Transcript_255/g.615 Transcript_255/m.615 type:complete len:883 (-) Transcript_255:90-2738(-)
MHTCGGVAVAAVAVAALLAARVAAAPSYGKSHNCYDDKIVVTQFELDSPLKFLWHMDQRGDTLAAVSEDMSLYRSHDGGQRWATTSPQDLGVATKNASRVHHIVLAAGWSRNKSDEVSYVAVAADDDSYWTTRNGGRSFTYHQGNFTKRPWYMIKLIPNPEHTEKLLALGYTHGCMEYNSPDPCSLNLYYSGDFGNTWLMLQDYVGEAVWEQGVNVLYLAANARARRSRDFRECSGRCDLYRASNWTNGRTNNHFRVYGGAFELFDLDHSGHLPATESHTRVVVVYLRVTEHDVLRTRLLISETDGYFFRQAVFPPLVDVDSPLVFDAEDGSIFVNVLDRDPAHVGITDFGDVYASDMKGQYYTRVLRYNKRNQQFGDFERVHGLNGVYIANAYEPTFRPQTPNREDLRTVMTFDLGNTWSYLTPPQTDVNGDPVTCTDADQCRLNLLGLADSHARSEQQGLSRFYAVPSAVGLMFGVGNVGQSLRLGYDDELNTYFTRDAGDTWKEVAKGPHAYEIGNHGSVIAMVARDSPSNVLKYSLTEGKDWHQCNFTESAELFDLENLVTELAFASEKFVVYGLQIEKSDGSNEMLSEGKRRGVLLGVDFTGRFFDTECGGFEAPDTDGSDFETWTPRNVAQGCVLGQRTTYIRRKADHECLHLDSHPIRKLKTDPCPCQEEDFECDDCFVRNITVGDDAVSHLRPCVNVNVLELEPELNSPSSSLDDDICHFPTEAEQCKEDVEWYAPTGYRLIAGDKCDTSSPIGKLRYAPRKKCGFIPGTTMNVSLIIAVVVLLVLITPCVFVGVVCVTKKPASVYRRLAPMRAKGAAVVGPGYHRLAGGGGGGFGGTTTTTFLDDDEGDEGGADDDIDDDGDDVDLDLDDDDE